MSSRKNSRGWEASPTPTLSPEHEEDSGEIDKIVSEEHDAFGCKRYEYSIAHQAGPDKIRWLNWQREDGTDTTWQYDLPDAPNVVSSWDRKIAHKNKKLACHARDVDIPEGSVSLHEFATFEQAKAVQEKIARTRRSAGSQSRYSNWDETIKRPDFDKNNGGPSISSRETSKTRQLSPTPDEPASKRRRTEPSGQPSMERRQRPPRRSPTPQLRKLEQHWNSLAEEAGAAGISIVDHPELSQVPPVRARFRYLEREYIFQEEGMKADPDFLINCDCVGSCSTAALCHCQSVVDIDEQATFAYDRKRLFIFGQYTGGIIVECNKRCSCSASCHNRVAQRPRDVPIQIFWTESNGWGVRATISLKRGKFVGVYTGRLIRRKHADSIKGEHKSYIFDLDAMEIDDEESFSVDAYRQGNWTRFINHSCEPNMQVKSVVWDTPHMNQPYLAFFAARDIPAMTELTIDYHPRAAHDLTGSENRPHDAKTCRCGTSSCRGWISV